MKREYIQRGNLFGIKEGDEVIIRAGSHLPYPSSDSVLRWSVSDIPVLIALLTALKEAE